MNTVFSAHHVLADLIMELQMSMQECGVWDCEVPTQEALSSVEPFCVDTLSFEQWLRFVMIERFRSILASGAALPSRCQIAPMAEEAFKTKPPTDVKRLVDSLNRIDEHLSGQA